MHGNKGKIRTTEARKKYADAKTGEKNCLWKGNDVSYSALHIWIRKWKGTPKLCEMCGTTTAKKYEWANVDHQYRRVLEDYIRMCTSCHRKYDYENHLADIASGGGTIKNKIGKGMAEKFAQKNKISADTEKFSLLQDK